MNFFCFCILKFLNIINGLNWKNIWLKVLQKSYISGNYYKNVNALEVSFVKKICT